MSPEQARGEPLIDIRSDIYSLGATLFHMLTGGIPFSGDTPAVVLSKRLVEPPPNPRTRRPDLSIAASNLVLRMMATDPAQRFPNAQSLVEVTDAVTQRGRGGLQTSEFAASSSSQSSARPARLAEPLSQPSARPIQPIPRRARRAEDAVPKKKATTALIAGGAVAVVVLLAVIFLATRESNASKAEKAFNACAAYWQSNRVIPRAHSHGLSR